MKTRKVYLKSICPNQSLKIDDYIEKPTLKNGPFSEFFGKLPIHVATLSFYNDIEPIVALSFDIDNSKYSNRAAP